MIPLPRKGNTRFCQHHWTISLHESCYRWYLTNRAEQIVEEEQAVIGSQSSRPTNWRDVQLKAVGRKTLGTSEGALSWFHRLQESVWLCLARRPLASRKWIQHRQPVDWSHQVVVRWTDKRVLLNGSAGDFFPTTVVVRQGCPLSSVLLIILTEKIMQKALTPEHSSENDCFAGDAEKIDALTVVIIGQRTTSFFNLLTTSICWEAVKKNAT